MVPVHVSFKGRKGGCYPLNEGSNPSVCANRFVLSQMVWRRIPNPLVIGVRFLTFLPYSPGQPVGDGRLISDLAQFDSAGEYQCRPNCEFASLPYRERIGSRASMLGYGWATTLYFSLTVGLVVLSHSGLGSNPRGTANGTVAKCLRRVAANHDTVG